MALRWCVLFALVGIALAQSAEGDGDLSARYGNRQAVDARALRFYCEAAESDETNFPELSNSGERDRTWSLLIQYPILSYLDSIRKDILIDQIVAIVGRGGVTINAADICIGYVAQYEVTLYRESVFINIYFRENNVSPDQIAAINDAFRNGHNVAAGDAGNSLVVPFLNTFAITINPFNEDVNGIAMNAHPGSTELPDDEDPTMRAVVINSIPGNAFRSEVFNDEPSAETFIEELMTGTYTRIAPLNEFAENPNPINYFLAGGDIVFIVFGVFFLFLLVVLIMIGFCIHPFFLA